MRVYLGATLRDLATLLNTGELGPAPLAGQAVTPTLREWYATADIEELEYAATEDAARASIARLGEEPDATHRRVVIVAEVPDPVVRMDAARGRSAVLVDSCVPLQKIDAVHVDAPDAEAAVRAAAEAHTKAQAGDPDAAFLVDEAFGYELLWYARQEIPDLLA